MLKKGRSFLILSITVVLLYLVVRRVGFSALLQTISGADLTWAAISVGLSPFLILVSVVKWQGLLKSQMIRVSLPRLFALYLVGRFFNYFLPSNVGGDVVRGYELGNYTKNGAEAMASVFVERFTGFFMMVVFAIASWFLNFRLLREAGLAPFMLLSVAGLLFLLWLIVDARPLNLVAVWITLPPVQPYLEKIKKFHKGINAYRQKPRALGEALFWSVVFLLLAALNLYSSAKAFHQPVSLIEMSAILPFILVVSMFPVTINGLGLQEWIYVLLFTMLGMPASVGLSTILLLRGKDIVMSLAGGILYPLIKISHQPVQAQEEAPEFAAAGGGQRVEPREKV